ncbi:MULTISPECIES: phosphate ABC transporter permease PstA [unclassified Arcicella]|uniref:phosphate ABC transporter permease PstA n=1 Tax=unclassified Arcicella TaxID=2644986 RepID=UPI002860ECAD|nr:MULTISPECIES: phosphate ABC transporter permease PstA [unclassified Arcicella]MDR6563562.1 phosphate transport system permease protein [Arcicella sp. BE51]MDR6813326.1 phosphate transport system permease protein [Arcicella sp. BE140]MDR6824640.1 phosphate transport system permease protein [Arcicella sp. BE139]
MINNIKNVLNWLLLLGSTLVVCLILGIILWDIFSKGFSSISWQFISQLPTEGMTKGGILPAIVGTVLLTFITTLFSVPFGVACALYLNEYAQPSMLTNIIRASIRNLAGIPSIIYGLFGLALFVQTLRLGTSVLSAGLTLGLLSLPYIITTTEEALKRIPNSMREATLALGVTQFETIKDVVLPQALPGILTGVILTMSRAAGETAPILFTGVAFYINGITTSVNKEFMALPYHLYMLSTQHQSIESVRPLAYGTAAVLILLVFMLNIIAFYIRFKHKSQA